MDISPKERLESLLKRITFTGMFSSADPTFTVQTEGSDFRVNLHLTVPDCKTKWPTEITAHYRLPRMWFESPLTEGLEDTVRRDIEMWLKRFWEHEFYESLNWDGKLWKDLHG